MQIRFRPRRNPERAVWRVRRTASPAPSPSPTPRRRTSRSLCTSAWRAAASPATSTQRPVPRPSKDVSSDYPRSLGRPLPIGLRPPGCTRPEPPIHPSATVPLSVRTAARVHRAANRAPRAAVPAIPESSPRVRRSCSRSLTASVRRRERSSRSCCLQSPQNDPPGVARGIPHNS